MVWAAGGSGAAPSRGATRGWSGPTILAQVTPPGADEGGVDEAEEELDPADTLDVEEGPPVSPDTTQSVPPPATPSVVPQASSADTLRSAAPDTSGLDTLQTTPGYVPLPPDSAARADTDSAAVETLSVKAPPPTPTPAARPAPSPSPAPKEKKPRSGILGIHPIAILLGLAFLHYFVTKSAGD